MILKEVGIFCEMRLTKMPKYTSVTVTVTVTKYTRGTRENWLSLVYVWHLMGISIIIIHTIMGEKRARFRVEIESSVDHFLHIPHKGTNKYLYRTSHAACSKIIIKRDFSCICVFCIIFFLLGKSHRQPLNLDLSMQCTTVSTCI